MFQFSKPTQTVLVTTRGKVVLSGEDVKKDNIITIDWHMPVSFKPPLYAISVGHSRFSHGLIRGSKVFVVNFMAFENKKEILSCGSQSGKYTDKFKESGLSLQEAETIDCPVIKEALSFIECEVVSEVEAGDHTIFIGIIKKKFQGKQGKRILHLGKLKFATTE